MAATLMARFYVYTFGGGGVPLVVDVQAEILANR
jgi:hypothetical protein